jgi:hypothetical protein
MRWSTKAVVAAGILAVLLVAAVPVALVVGLVMMLLGHLVGGLALFGGSILAATMAVVIAGVSGVREVRRAITRQWDGYLASQEDLRVVRLSRGDYDYTARGDDWN